MSEIYKRGEIYSTDFGDGLGSEQMGLRPALIIQNNAGNFYSPTLIVAAITTQRHNKPALPTHYFVGTDTGLDAPSIVLLEQLRTVSKERLHSYIGELSSRDMKRIVYPLAVSLGMLRYQRKNLVLTLCKKCTENFRLAHYVLYPVGERRTKETCVRCNYYMGYDYEIIPPVEDK